MASPNQPSFSSAQLYDHLKVTRRSIQVLDLDLPRSPTQNDHRGEAPLTGQLRVVSLSGYPKFTTLSYVWSEFSEPSADVISYNGCPLRIMPNCRDVLYALSC